MLHGKVFMKVTWSSWKNIAIRDESTIVKHLQNKGKKSIIIYRYEKKNSKFKDPESPTPSKST